MLLLPRQSAVIPTTSLQVDETGGNVSSTSVMVNLEVSDVSISGDDSELESDWETGKKGRKFKLRGQPASKRVKVVDSASASAHKTTSIVRRKKDVSVFLSMPLDVICAIFLELTIKDLIALTRTSKSMRDTLLEKHATIIWKTVRENSSVPEPPHDFSEQRWASFLFGGTQCQCCGAPNIRTVEFFLRRRLCTKCKKDNYVVESRFARMFPHQEKAVLDLIPFTDVGGWAHGHASSSRFFWREDIEKMIQRWDELKSKSRSVKGKQQLQDFCEQRKKFVATVLQEGKNYIEWRERSSKEHSNDIHERKKARYEAICQRFRDLGYEDCDIREIEYEKSVAVTNELTDRGWTRIRPSLEQVIIKARDSRLDFELRRRRAERFYTFKKVFDAHALTVLPPLWLQYPHWQEVANFPEIIEIIDSPDNVIVNAHSFAPAMAELPSLIAKWLEDKRAALKKQLVAANMDDASTMTPTSMIDVDVLNLATSVFKCAGEGCMQTPLYAETWSDPLFGWTDAASHMCSGRTSSLWNFSPLTVAYTGIPSYIKAVIVPFRDASVVAAKLVRLVGLDPSRVTIVDMDRSGYYFLCSGCPLVHNRRQKAYPWRAAVAHAVSHKHSATTSWQALTPTQALCVQVPENPNNQRMCWSCNHCSVHIHAWASFSDVRCHVVSEHNIQNPREPTDLFCCRRVHLSKLPLPYWSRPRPIAAGSFPRPIVACPRPLVARPRPLVACPRPLVVHNDRDIRCQHCRHTNPRLFNLNGVKNHLKDKHGIGSPQPTTDYIHI
ncbi:hypothetical protein H2248_004243 [Termitomyces sp. 'cryptogamus']|nr:hypothetical protein H2248_004243 [Termitomyces sp. 'cryptogamus']